MSCILAFHPPILIDEMAFEMFFFYKFVWPRDNAKSRVGIYQWISFFPARLALQNWSLVDILELVIKQAHLNSHPNHISEKICRKCKLLHRPKIRVGGFKRGSRCTHPRRSPVVSLITTHHFLHLLWSPFLFMKPKRAYRDFNEIKAFTKKKKRQERTSCNGWYLKGPFAN